jgi:hypothetical protein
VMSPLAKIPSIAVVVASAALFLLGSMPVAAATDTLECGLFRDYTAPDPIGDTPGSITFGLSGPAETIAADATLVPPTDTNLASLQGGAPTCLTVTRESGVITSLAFAASGTIRGIPELVADLFGPGQDAYVISDRLFTPAELVATNAGLSALIKTAADSESTFTVTFQIDLSSGVPTGFVASTTLSGTVGILTGGDIAIGSATLPDEAISPAARQDLHEAANLGVQATVIVDGIGTLDQSSEGGVSVAITLSVSFAAPPTTPAPDPDEVPDTALSAMPGGDQWFVLGALLLVTSLIFKRAVFGPSQ